MKKGLRKKHFTLIELLISTFIGSIVLTMVIVVSLQISTYFQDILAEVQFATAMGQASEVISEGILDRPGLGEAYADSVDIDTTDGKLRLEYDAMARSGTDQFSTTGDISTTVIDSGIDRKLSTICEDHSEFNPLSTYKYTIFKQAQFGVDKNFDSEIVSLPYGGQVLKLRYLVKVRFAGRNYFKEQEVRIILKN